MRKIQDVFSTPKGIVIPGYGCTNGSPWNNSVLGNAETKPP